jgi:hypothetical protein
MAVTLWDVGRDGGQGTGQSPQASSHGGTRSTAVSVQPPAVPEIRCVRLRLSPTFQHGLSTLTFRNRSTWWPDQTRTGFYASLGEAERKLLAAKEAQVMVVAL